MPSYLRLTLLGMFGAAGVALAMALAATPPPEDSAETDSPVTDSAATESATEIASTAPMAGGSSAPSLVAPAMPATLPPTPHSKGIALPPWQAPHQGPIGNPFDPLQVLWQDAPPPLPSVALPDDAADPFADDSPLAFGPPEPDAILAPVNPLPLPTLQAGEGDDALSVNVHATDLREVLAMLSRQAGLNILASKSVQGPVSASLTNVDVETALAAILKSTGYVARREGNFIFVGTPADFEQMDRSADRVATRIYRLNYVKASEMQGLISPMLTPDIGTVSVSTAAEAGIAPDSSAAGGNNFAGCEVLLVRDYEAVLAQVDQVIDEVDHRPEQVAIEAMILSVKLSDSNKMGIDFELLRNKANIRILSGSPLSDLAKIQTSPGALNIGFLDSSLGVFLEALETVGDVNVIASPRLMCLNKQRAAIHIGREVGYVSTTVTENAATQTVEFLEVGTQLRLRPYISRDGMIRLEIHPELSTGDVSIKGGFTVPDKDVTQVTTNVMVRDGATVILGGLMREDLKTDTSQIPILGNLPLVGALFRSKTEEIDRIEVVILITPHIVYEPKAYFEGDRAECEFYQRQAVYADKMSPIGKRYFGRRYYRLADAAWAAGDGYAALRYANLSIHFDPTNRAAINLRGEVASTMPPGSLDVDNRLRVGLAPWNHPVAPHRFDEWMFQQLEMPPPERRTPGPPAPTPMMPNPAREIVRPPAPPLR